MKNNLPNPSFWKNKKVLITGHTGFKGSWLSIWLSTLGANIVGFSEKPPTTLSLFHEAKINTFVDSIIGDIRDKNLLESCIKKSNPDIIFHMAAQSLVRESYSRPLETYEVNVLGTLNLLEAVRKSETVKALINVTSDKCYKNIETLSGYKETDELGGKDPYSNSKACSELVTQAYQKSFFNDNNIGIATARAGNVLGGGDWAKDRLIPDIFNSIQNKTILKIRNPKSVRPWQYILDLLNGYLLLAENLFKEPDKFSGAWNFGPKETNPRSVEWVVKYLSSNLGGLQFDIDNNILHPFEANFLNLDISKALSLLEWYPKVNLEQTLKNIIEWQKSWNKIENSLKFCLKEIEEFKLLS